MVACWVKGKWHNQGRHGDLVAWKHLKCALLVTFQLAGTDLAVQYKPEVLADCEQRAGGSFFAAHSALCVETNSPGEMLFTMFAVPEHLQCLAPALLQSFPEGKGTVRYLSSFRGNLCHSTALLC